MALDAALLERAAQPVLRVWRLSQEAELVGTHEGPAAAAAVRRPTGGGNFVVPASAGGWTVVIPTEEEPVDVFEQMACAAASSRSAGFRDPDAIEADGKRVGWVGGASLGMSVLAQGVFLEAAEEYAEGLRAALGKAFSVEVVDGDLTPEEREAEGPSGSDPGTPLEGVSGELRTKGGIVRATIVPGEGRNVVRSARFTGDFNAYPRDIVGLLEETIAGTPIDEAPGKIEDFFAQTQGRVAGVEPGEFFTVLSLAFMKVRRASSSAPDPTAWKKGQL
jgi:hypothetical protein